MSVDVTDRDELINWLHKQPREMIVPIVVRSALRIFPLLVTEIYADQAVEKLVFPSFRAVMIAWEIGEYPEKMETLQSAASAAVSSANVESAYASMDAAYSAATASIATDISFSSFIAIASIAAASATDASAANASLYYDVNIRPFHRPFNSSLLWETEKSAAPPDEIVKYWEELKANLLSLNSNWHVWTDWYEARLYPDKFPAPNKKLELARAMIPNEIWDQGWEVVNPHIEALIEEHAKEPELPSEDVGVPASIARDMSGRSLVVCTPLESCENVALLSVALPWTGSNAVPDPLEVISNFEGDVFDLSRCERSEDLLAFLVDGAPAEIDKQILYDEVSAALDGGQASVYFGSIESLLADALKNVGPDSLRGYAKLSDRQFRVGLIRKGKSIIFITLVLGGSAIGVKSSYDIAGAYVEHITSELKKPAVVENKPEVQRQKNETAKSSDKKTQDGNDLLDT